MGYDDTPTPRSRNAAATKASILEAARRRFACEGYDGAGLREIAADAGVDAALISRYFGGKEDLFSEVLAADGGVDELLQGEAAGFGERIARMLVLEPRDDNKVDKLLIMLRSASSTKASEVIRRSSQETFYGPFEAWLGGEHAAARARLAAGMIVGFAITRAIDENYLLNDSEREVLCERLAEALQRAVD